MADVGFESGDVGFQDGDVAWQDHVLQSVAYGVQVPDADEQPESWQVWKDVLGLAPAISGDIDWGDLVFEEAYFGPVRRLTEGTKALTIIKNKYGIGSGICVAYIRGSTTAFVWDAVSPSWQLYSAPVYCTWTYVQLKVDVG